MNGSKSERRRRLTHAVATGTKIYATGHKLTTVLCSDITEELDAAREAEDRIASLAVLGRATAQFLGSTGACEDSGDEPLCESNVCLYCRFARSVDLALDKLGCV